MTRTIQTTYRYRLNPTVAQETFEGVTKGATFKREPCGHWFVSIVTEQQAAPRTERPVQTHVGVDVGLPLLAVCSTGETIANPRWYRTQSRKLRRAQQALSRKVRGSHNRGKVRAAGYTTSPSPCARGIVSIPRAACITTAI